LPVGKSTVFLAKVHVLFGFLGVFLFQTLQLFFLLGKGDFKFGALESGGSLTSRQNLSFRLAKSSLIVAFTGKLFSLLHPLH